MGWKTWTCHYDSSKASLIILSEQEKSIQHAACLEVWWVHRRCKQPINHYSGPASLTAANLVLLCKCICLHLIAAASSIWVDQKYTFEWLFWGCFRPLVNNVRNNLIKLHTNTLNYEDLADTEIPVSAQAENNTQSFWWISENIILRAKDFKNRTVEPLFRAGWFVYDGSDICMADSDAAETFSAVHDKLHLLIQPDSSPTS